LTDEVTLDPTVDPGDDSLHDSIVEPDDPDFNPEESSDQVLTDE
jgi:hypothetical protein